MSSFETVSLVVSIVGSLGIIISLWFVYLQTRIFARQTEYVARSLGSSLSHSINGQIQDITRFFIEYPELRPYFYQSQQIDENHADYARVEAIAEVILDIFFSVFSEVPSAMNVISNRSADATMRAYVRDSFSQSPILVKFLRDHRSWYDDNLWNLMNEAVKGSERSEPSASAKQPVS